MFIHWGLYSNIANKWEDTTYYGISEWIKRYPQTIYKTGSSPWGRKLPWGDVTVSDKKLNLLIYDWPLDGEIFLPGLKSKIKTANLWVDGRQQKVETSRKGSWTQISLPLRRPEKLISVIEGEAEGQLEVDRKLSIDPVYSTAIPVAFAKAEACEIKHKRWMESMRECQWEPYEILRSVMW